LLPSAAQSLGAQQLPATQLPAQQKSAGLAAHTWLSFAQTFDTQSPLVESQMKFAP
jgi:hypothetical protein